MKIPLSWLKEFIDIKLSPEQIAETLTLAGLEVEGIEGTSVSFTGVVAGTIRTKTPHPHAEKLCVLTVFDGTEEWQVVCGDLSCKVGQKTAFAKINAVLKDEEDKTWTIKKTKIREIDSFGMLCSEKDLKISDRHEKIIQFPSDVADGTDASTLFIDPIFEIALTPNLGHCMSILGIARELAALLNVKIKKHPLTLPQETATSIEELIDVEIQDQAQCSQYSCRLIKNITVGPSPDWIKKRLEACGLRSINSIVDVTNYILLEVGQPLHAFDYDRIAGKKIVITSQASAKDFITLDEKPREIPEGTLLVCDVMKPLAIAGVMGGLDSAVSEKTQNILIESALFSAQAVRKSSKTLNLRTDASGRFEKGIDPKGVIDALNRACSLLCQVSSGTLVQGILNRETKAFEPTILSCRLSRINALLGTMLSQNEVIALFERLDMKATAKTEDLLTVQVPSYRHDVRAEIDLVEEAARLYGYQNIPKKTPHYVTSPISDSPIYALENEVRERLVREGLQECITCDLISPFLAELTAEKAMQNNLIHVLHPSSIDQSILRPSLLPGLLQVVKLNQDHQNWDMNIFEVGRIHFKDKEHFKEQSITGIILTGKSTPYHWDPKPREVDFFDLKGIVENLLQAFGIHSFTVDISHLHNFHPGRQGIIKVDQMILGVMGEIHPAHLQALDIKSRVLFAELNLHDMYLMKRKEWQVDPLNAYPGSERDWTLTLKDEVPIAKVLSVIQMISSHLLEQVILLDLYKNEQLGKDRKNATFRFIYRDKQKTLSLETIEREHAKMTQEVAEKLRDCLICDF